MNNESTDKVTSLDVNAVLLSFSLFPHSRMAKGSRKGKKNLPSNSIPTSSSNSLKLTLPARHNIALNPPTCAEPVADPVIQPGPDPVTPASPVSQTPAVTEAFPHCNNEQVEQEVEILSVSHPVEIVPAAKLIDNFFTLEDSQDEEEISPLPTQKPCPCPGVFDALDNSEWHFQVNRNFS